MVILPPIAISVGPAGAPVTADHDTAIAHKIFPCLADHGRFYLIIAQLILYKTGGLQRVLPPEAGSIPDLHPIIINPDIDWLSRPSRDHDMIVPGPLQA